MEYKTLLLLVVISFVSGQDTQQDCEDVVCTEEYNPLCGSNGRTFSNPCKFGIAQCGDVSLQIEYAGECTTDTNPDCDTMCTKEYNPQCGSDGRTYSNPCTFKIGQCHQVSLTLSYKGECKPDAHACNDRVCAQVFEPQCGNDGRTYSNLCELQRAQCAKPSLHLSYEGGCKISSLIAAEEEHHHSEVKPGFCPILNIGELGRCVNECKIDNECDGASKCCDNGCALVCRPARVSKPGRCPVAPTLKPDEGPCVSPESNEATCDSDVDCLDAQKCCFDGCQSVCLDPEPREGFCPALPEGGKTNGTCENPCTHDHQCDFPKKCCAAECGQTCVEAEIPKEGLCAPVNEETSLGSCHELCGRDSECTGDENALDIVRQLTVFSVPKEGLCAPVNEETSLGSCHELCGRDSECTGDEKCCSNGCGHTCQEPEYGTCVKEFRKYHNGETKLDVNNCDECTCTNGTLECTTRDCFCEFHGKKYASGDIFEAKDDCNRCQCFGLKVVCTDFICHERPDESKRILGIVLGCIFGMLSVILIVAVALVVVSTLKKKGKPKSSKGEKHSRHEAEPLPAKV